MKIDVKYFAWVKSNIGLNGEVIELDRGEITLAELIDHLKNRSKGHAKAFENPNTVKYAVNMEYAGDDTVIYDGDEVGCFPPVTGGAA